MGTIDEQTLSFKVCNEKVALFYRTCNKTLMIQGPPAAL